MKYIIIFIFILYTGSVTAVPAKRIWNGGIPDEPMLHVCMLFVVNDNPAVGYLGGGTIISNRHVITAAHVLQNALDINIGYGSNTRADMDTRSTRTFFIHNEFDPASRAKDIAIIFLTGPAFTDEFYKVAQFPATGPMLSDIGIVAGFGFYTPDAQIPDVLQYAELHVVEPTNCERFQEATDQTHHFCVRSPNQIPSHLCPGDNGNGFFYIEEVPFMDEVDGEMVELFKKVPFLYGIATHIVQGCTWQDQPALFIEVVPYLSWIRIFVPEN